MLNTFEKTTTKGLDIIEYYEKLCSRVKDIEVPNFSEHYDRQVYCERDINSDQLNQMVRTVKTVLSTPQITGKASKTFAYKNVKAHTIRPVSGDKAWIAYHGEKMIKLMQNDGKCITPVKKNTDDHIFFVPKEETTSSTWILIRKSY